MDININLMDFVSEGEVKEAVRDEIRHCVRQVYSKENDMQRLVSNLAYEFVFKMVDEQFEGKLADLLRANIERVINDMTDFTVFRGAGTQILEEEVAKRRSLIAERIEEVIKDYPFDDVKAEIGALVYECVMDKMFPEGSEV